MSAPANTFGAITHEGGRWRIECEPHVRTKLRRLFPQVDQRASEVVWLSGSAENSRDLLWFINRYPMLVSPLKLLKGLSADHVEAESLVHQLLSHVRAPDLFELAMPPRDYQAEAASLARIKAGLLLADDVGLGKTASAICPMVMPEYLPALVVTLSHLPPLWVNELYKFAPNLKVHVLKSGRPYDLLESPKRRRGAQAQTGLFDEEQPRLPDVIVCNHHKLAGWAETLAGFIRYVVFDEVQELRAGAGTDGLQHVCKVGIFAELDWSPGVHVQCIGRFHRDEQDEPSIAYFLLAEDGADPVMADIVGLKKTQLEGVRDPDAELLEELEIDAGGVKRMAESYLAKLGQRAPARGAQGAKEDEIEEAFA